VIARAGAYHGNSRGALDASDRSLLKAGYEPWLGQTVRVPLANPYRDGMTGADHAEVLDRTIREVGPERVAAFLAEPVAGATLGAVVPPDDYWPAVAEVCRRHGVLVIADEVMTGLRSNRTVVRRRALGCAARHPHVRQGRVERLLAARV
jgi:adenosylmethionine-8-amino-7-oxononanoate aminotransferase